VDPKLHAQLVLLLKGLKPIVGNSLAMLHGKGFQTSIKRLSPDDRNVKQKSFDKDFILSFRHDFLDREQLRYRTRFF
jgi:hypothetical protein